MSKFSIASRISAWFMLLLMMSACSDINPVINSMIREGFSNLTPLMKAAGKGDVTKTRELIAKGEPVDETSDRGWTALMFAANKGHTDVALALLDAGSDPNIISDRITGNTMAPYPKSNALREALRNGHIELANILLDSDAEPDPTAFAIAGGTGDLKLLQKMVDLGADPNTPSEGPDAYHPSALCVASLEGKLEVVRWLLQKGADPNLNALGCSAVFSAVGGDHPEVLRLLLAHGADPNYKIWPGDLNPLLHYLVLQTRSSGYDPDLDVLELLLANGADKSYTVSHWPFEGRTALEHAMYERENAPERVELPGFNYDWPGGVTQFQQRFGAIAALLQD